MGPGRKDQPRRRLRNRRAACWAARASCGRAVACTGNALTDVQFADRRCGRDASAIEMAIQEIKIAPAPRQVAESHPPHTQVRPPSPTEPDISGFKLRWPNPLFLRRVGLNLAGRVGNSHLPSSIFAQQFVRGVVITFRGSIMTLLKVLMNLSISAHRVVTRVHALVNPYPLTC